MQLRPVSPTTDMGALDELFAAISEVDGHPPIGEHKYLDLLNGSAASPSGLVAEAGGETVAYVATRPTGRNRTWAMELAVHPVHRSPAGIGSLIRAAVSQIGDAGGCQIRAWAFLPEVARALESEGFTLERELHQLRRALPAEAAPAIPPGAAVRSFRPGVDDAVWIEVNNAAFAGHPENGAWTREILDDRKSQPWFDAEGFRMAWLHRELVGFCWTKLHTPELGEIYVIAVSPARRGQGWGRLLTLEGMRYLSDIGGASEVMLYVDADNDAALGLYTELGFELDHVDRSLVRTV